jgi:hypothetical protein
MPQSLPLYAQLQNQLDRYSSTPMEASAVSDLLVTVAMHLTSDHPHAARNLMVEAEVAQNADSDLLL